MNIEHILQRHMSATPLSDSPPSSDAENVEDLGGWGLLRGQRDRSVSLELRKKDGSVLAVPYALIEQFLYTPSDGITLRVAGREIRIRGRGMNEPSSTHPLTMLTALTRHRVSWIAERSRSDGPSSSETLVIEFIDW